MPPKVGAAHDQAWAAVRELAPLSQIAVGYALTHCVVEMLANVIKATDMGRVGEPEAAAAFLAQAAAMGGYVLHTAAAAEFAGMTRLGIDPRVDKAAAQVTKAVLEVINPDNR